MYNPNNQSQVSKLPCINYSPLQIPSTMRAIKNTPFSHLMKYWLVGGTVYQYPMGFEWLSSPVNYVVGPRLSIVIIHMVVNGYQWLSSQVIHGY